MTIKFLKGRIVMDINECAERILTKNLKQYKKIPYIRGYQLYHIAKIIEKKYIYRGGVETGKRITVYGYRRDITRFLKYFPKNSNELRVKYAKLGQWQNVPGKEFNNSELIKRMSALETDLLIIVSEDLRYLLQMCMISAKVSYEMVDIYEMIKREYKVILEAGMPGNAFCATMRNSLASFLAKYTEYGRKRWKQTKYIDNYDAIFVRRHYYEKAKIDKEKEYYLSELITNYLLIRDYQNAFKYIDEYTSLFGMRKNPFIKLKKEFLDLFAAMKKAFRAKKDKDIVVFWCDSLPYEDFRKWNFLDGLERQSLSFQNAYAHIPYTHSTSQAMYTGIPYFEGKLYRRVEKGDMIRTGKLLDYLKSNHYDICEVGGSYINRKYYREPYYAPKGMYAPASMVLWDVLAVLLEKISEKNYIICYMNCETHGPFWNGESDELRPEGNGFFVEMDKFTEQRRQSAAYLEKQIMYYLDFMRGDACKIFMSDHGLGAPAYLERRLHPFCFVNDPNIMRGRYNGYFSYLNFFSLIYYILQPNEENFKKIFSEYVLIQNDHPYSKNLCDEIFEKYKNNEDIQIFDWMGYRGIIKNGYKLIKVHTGEQKWFDSDDNEINPKDILEEGLVEFMDMKIGDEFPDIENEEHYKETQKLYERLDINAQ